MANTTMTAARNSEKGMLAGAVPESRDYAAEVALLLAAGTPVDLYAAGEAATETLAHASAGLIPWFALAFDVHTAKGMEAAEFGEMVGADKNYLMRLRNAHVLYTAHAAKGRPLTPIEAMKVANVKSKKAVDEIAAEVKAGRDPLGTGKGPVKPNAGAGNGRKGKGRTNNTGKGKPVTAENYAEVMEVIMADLGSASGESKSRILAAARAIVDALESEGVEAADLAA